MSQARMKLLIGMLMVAATTATLVWPALQAQARAFTIATWNMEWLVSPTTAHAGRLACRNGRRSTLPCDVAEDMARDSADLARIAAHARQLDADIIAFQEVENERIATQVFGGYRICMADGNGVQHVGFAVRPSLPHQCGPAVESLAMNGRSRKGMSLRFTPAHGAPVELLAVHLKSGCSREALDSGSAACQMLREQAEHLSAWVAERNAQHAAFIVLGDFNRVSPESTDDPFWQPLLADGAELLATQLPFRNCRLGQPYTAFIDHILISASLQKRLIPGTAHHAGFRNADIRYRLPDHCPVSVSLKLDGTPGLPAR